MIQPGRAPRLGISPSLRAWLIVGLSVATVAAAAVFAGADAYLAGARGSGVQGPVATSLSVALHAAPLSDQDIHFKLPDTVGGLPLTHDSATQQKLEGLAKAFSVRQAVIDTPVAGAFQLGQDVAILVGLPTVMQEPSTTLDQIFRDLATSGLYRVRNRQMRTPAVSGGAMECADLSAAANPAIVIGACANYDDAGIEILLETRQTSAAVAGVLSGLLPQVEVK